MILLCFTTCTDACGSIVLEEDTTFEISRGKVSHR